MFLKPITYHLSPSYVFFGTPEFAELILKRLCEAGMPPAAIVTNPDRPTGRKKVISPPPVKRFAIEAGLGAKIFQPETKTELLEISAELHNIGEFGIVAAYAHIIPGEVIGGFTKGIIGVHPSLLPYHRGATPIQSAILSGDKETGVTLYLLDEGIDSGNIIAQKKKPHNGENYTNLMHSLAEIAGDMLIETIPDFIEGKIVPVEQDDRTSTYTSKFAGEDGYVSDDELRRAENGESGLTQTVYRKILALNPEPGVYTIRDGKRIKLLSAEISEGHLRLTKIQREGKTPEQMAL